MPKTILQLTEELDGLLAQEAKLKAQMRVIRAKVKAVEKHIDAATLAEDRPKPAVKRARSLTPVKRQRSPTPPRASPSSGSSSSDSEDEGKQQPTQQPAASVAATSLAAPSAASSSAASAEAPASRQLRKPGDIPCGVKGWIPTGECKSCFKRYFFKSTNTGYKHTYDSLCLKGTRQSYDVAPPEYSDSD